MKDLLVVIPAYNEAANIKMVVEELISVCPEYDYVVVNDGSKDDTAGICRENGFNLIDLPVNLGLAGCFQTGVKYAMQKGYEAVLQFDGDGQHCARYIRPMRDLLSHGYDMVLGSRFVTKKKPWTMRMFGGRMIALAIFAATGMWLTDPTCGMRMFGAKTAGQFAARMNFGPEPDTVSFLMRQGAKVVEMQTEVRERTGGESYLKPLTAVKYMVRMLTSILIIQPFGKNEK